MGVSHLKLYRRILVVHVLGPLMTFLDVIKGPPAQWGLEKSSPNQKIGSIVI